MISIPVGVGVLSQPFNSYGLIGPISVADIGLLLALGSIAVQQTLRGEGRLAKGIQPLIVLLTLLMAWLIVVAEAWHVTAYFGFLLTVYLVGFYVQSVDDLETILWAAFLGAFLISVPTVYSIFIDPSFGGRVAGYRSVGSLPTFPRTTGIRYGSLGAFSTYLLGPLPFGIIQWWRRRQRWLLVPISTIILAALAIQSRATWVAMVVASGVLIAGIFGRKLWDTAWRNAGASGIVLLIGSTGAAVFSLFLIQISRRNAALRLRQYIRSGEILYHHPLVGVKPPIIQHFVEHIPHNVLLLIGVVSGIPGMVLLLAILGIATTGLWRGWHKNVQTRYLALSVAAGLAANIVNMSFAPANSRIVWILLAMSSILITVDGESILMANWFDSALVNSRTASVLQEWGQGSALVSALTTDLTGLKESLWMGWQKSRCHSMAAKIKTAVDTSALFSFANP